GVAHDVLHDGALTEFTQQPVPGGLERRLGTAHDRHRRPVACQFQRAGTPDAPAASGHQRGHTRQCTTHSSSSHPSAYASDVEERAEEIIATELETLRRRTEASAAARAAASEVMPM